jgi:hypothetical protein
MSQNETNVLKTQAEIAPTTGSIGKASSLERPKPGGSSGELLRAELAEVRKAWVIYRKTRDRGGVYQYLASVFALVQKWTRLGCAKSRSRRALRVRNVHLAGKGEPFAAVITCTADVHRRTVSKWSRVLRYAAEVKKDREELVEFIKRNGGINACASKFSDARSQPRKRSR